MRVTSNYTRQHNHNDQNYRHRHTRVYISNSNIQQQATVVIVTYDMCTIQHSTDLTVHASFQAASFPQHAAIPFTAGHQRLHQFLVAAVSVFLGEVLTNRGVHHTLIITSADDILTTQQMSGGHGGTYT